jgi:phage terminase large subunit-like protein
MIAIAYSGDEPDQLRGPQHGSAWVDELAKFKYPKDTWDNLELGLRLGDRPQVVITTTPRPIPIIKALIADPMVIDIQGSTFDNLANLPDSFIRRIRDKYDGTFLGQQELYGEVLEDREGALWKRDTIENNRWINEVPPLTRIVVGVDPPGGIAECGIIVAGKGRGKHAFVLEDPSLAAPPDKWAEAAVTAFHKNKADRVVAETNYGGDMVENTIRTVDVDVSYKAVHASRGKQIRAEPVAALYEQGRVHHVGTFGELEDEMCTWVPGEGMASPNRLDALVWALTELMLEKQYKPVRLARYA